MFTICFFLFSSVTAVTPIKQECVVGTRKDVAEATARCAELDRDPLTTCEAQRMGALKLYVRIRQLETSPVKTQAPATKATVL